MLSDIHVALHLATLASTFNIVRSDYIFSTSLTCIIQFNLESISRAQHSHRSLVMGQLAIIDLARLMDACLANITGHNRAHYWPKLDAAMLTSQLLLRKCVCANRLIYSSEGAPVELWSRVACVCVCALCHFRTTTISNRGQCEWTCPQWPPIERERDLASCIRMCARMVCPLIFAVLAIQHHHKQSA